MTVLVANVKWQGLLGASEEIMTSLVSNPVYCELKKAMPLVLMIVVATTNKLAKTDLNWCYYCCYYSDDDYEAYD